LTLDLPIDVPMANGAFLYRPGELVMCGQGTMTREAGIYHVNLHTFESTQIVTKWDNKPFNSPNDIFVNSHNYLWFTDPTYGFEQKFWPHPVLGNYVWRVRLDEHGKATDVKPIITDGFEKPNGIVMTPDSKKLFVTDTGYFLGDGTPQPDKPHCVYEFSMENHYPEKKRLFAISAVGIPDGIKIDKSGRYLFYSASDGVVINDIHTGHELGKLHVEGGVSNFTLLEKEPTKMIVVMMNEKRIIVAEVASE